MRNAVRNPGSREPPPFSLPMERKKKGRSRTRVDGPNHLYRLKKKKRGGKECIPEKTRSGKGGEEGGGSGMRCGRREGDRISFHHLGVVHRRKK